MTEDEQILAFFINGITYITGSTQLAERVREIILRWKGQLWLVTLLFWTIILYLWLF